MTTVGDHTDRDESIAMFRDSAATYLRAADQRQRVRALEAAGGGFDRAVWAQLAELGWCSVLMPEADGGLGLGLSEVAAIAQEAGRQLLPEPFVDAGVHPVALLARLAASALRSELLQGIQSGALVAGVAWQESAGELEAGNGLTSASAPADGAAGRVQLSGQKRFVRPGAGADGWIVAAELNDHRVLAWVRSDAPGLTAQHERGVDGSVMTTLTFDATPAQILAEGEAAQSALQQANDMARIAQAAELAGIAQRSLELTRDYMNTRVQFGKPIASFQALQHRMVDALIQVELAQACLRAGLV